MRKGPLQSRAPNMNVGYEGKPPFQPFYPSGQSDTLGLRTILIIDRLGNHFPAAYTGSLGNVLLVFQFSGALNLLFID